jgi:hypothetical protein
MLAVPIEIPGDELTASPRPRHRPSGLQMAVDGPDDLLQARSLPAHQ